MKLNIKKSVMIGTPMYGGLCYHGYASGVAESVLNLKEHGIDLFWFFVANESLITRGRNYVVDYFLKSDCTHLMFIDADIHFRGDAIYSLLSADEDVVCAAYPKKFIDWERIKNAPLNVGDVERLGASYVINFVDNKLQTPNDKGLIEVRHAGTGFMLIHRRVFEKMKPKMKKARASNFGRFDNWYTEYFKTDIDNDGVFQSEDWFFCNKWRKMGGKIYLMPSIELNHIGVHVYKGDIINCGANIT